MMDKHEALQYLRDRRLSDPYKIVGLENIPDEEETEDKKQNHNKHNRQIRREIVNILVSFCTTKLQEQQTIEEKETIISLEKMLQGVKTGEEEMQRSGLLNKACCRNVCGTVCLKRKTDW
nr:PREDICTED: uncharacterized protein LOC100142126 isoform X3 [Tribolium castaneum]|eukprot:XP_015839190.1 PREDICTED: uncharacterized protein LOC100142126 isoform X3 [Tribolium castaneum]